MPPTYDIPSLPFTEIHRGFKMQVSITIMWDPITNGKKRG